MPDDDFHNDEGQQHGNNKESFHPDLVRKLITSHISSSKDEQQTIRISEEALVAAGELLRLFVLEAKDRASIEAECDYEATLEDHNNYDDDDDDDDDVDTNDNNNNINNINLAREKVPAAKNKRPPVPIQTVLD
jgi:CENP-S associating Centromere protein X